MDATSFRIFMYTAKLLITFNGMCERNSNCCKRDIAGHVADCMTHSHRNEQLEQVGVNRLQKQRPYAIHKSVYMAFIKRA